MTAAIALPPDAHAGLLAWLTVLQRAAQADRTYLGVLAMQDIGVAPVVGCRSCPVVARMAMSIPAVVAHLRESTAATHDLVILPTARQRVLDAGGQP